MKDKATEPRWHPDLGKRMFTPEHAANLDAAEKINPSGWVEYTGQDQQDQGEVESSSSKKGLNATGNTTNSGNSNGKADKKQKANSKGKKSGK